VSDLLHGSSPPVAPTDPHDDAGFSGPGEAIGAIAWIDPSELSPNPMQPRADLSDDGLSGLAESIRNSGMIQPISVRRVGGRLQIIAGERRWRASQLAGLERVPVLIREVDDRGMLEMALVENIQREDLNPLDRAKAYRRYCDTFAASAEQVAERVGEDRTTVTNYLRLLDLPADIQSLLATGRISMGHARSLAGVPDDDDRRRLAKAVVAHELSVRALEEIVRREKRGEVRAPSTRRSKDKSANLRDLEERLSLACGTKVAIQEGRGKGTGRIVIEYYNLDDFDRVASKLGLPPE